MKPLPEMDNHTVNNLNVQVGRKLAQPLDIRTRNFFNYINPVTHNNFIMTGAYSGVKSVFNVKSYVCNGEGLPAVLSHTGVSMMDNASNGKTVRYV